MYIISKNPKLPIGYVRTTRLAFEEWVVCPVGLIHILNLYRIIPLFSGLHYEFDSINTFRAGVKNSSLSPITKQLIILNQTRINETVGFNIYCCRYRTVCIHRANNVERNTLYSVHVSSRIDVRGQGQESIFFSTGGHACTYSWHYLFYRRAAFSL